MFNSGISKLFREYRELNQNPIISFRMTVGLPDENNIFNWRVTLLGPPDTPYRGGIFFLSLNFPQNYPSSPPKVVFNTPIYHINVKRFRDNSGSIGQVDLAILNLWKPEYTARDILISAFSLFYMNKDNSPYSLEMSDEYRNNKNLYIEKCKYFTSKYANPSIGFREYENWDFSYAH